MSEQLSLLPNPIHYTSWPPAAIAVTKSLEPVLKQTARAGAETMSFATKRAAAWAEHGKRVAAVKQPADLLGAHQAFWQQTMQDYVEFNRAMLTGWMAAWQPSATTQPTAATPQRDVLSFREQATPEAYAPREADSRSTRAA